jgi:uncharacterized protein
MKQKNGAIISKYENGYLVYNPYTDVIAYSDDCNFSSEKIHDYIEKGIFFEDDKMSGKTISLYIINKAKAYSVNDLQLTDAFSFSCNLRCVYCMQQNITRASIMMSAEKRVDEWKTLMQIHNAKNLSVCLFGGEPFFNIVYLKEVMEIAARKIGAISYTAITNGTLINETVIRLINTYKIKSIQITLDGTERIHNERRTNGSINCYQTIIANIKKVLEKTRCRITINTVMDISNFQYIDKMTDEIISLFNQYIFGENPRIIFNYGMECFPFGKSTYVEKNIPETVNYNIQFYKILEQEIQKGISVTEVLPTPTCIAKKDNDILISPNGDLYKCITALGSEVMKLSSYEDAVRNPLKYFEKIAYYSERINPQCLDCRYLALCNGGCYFEAINRGMDISCRKVILDNTIDEIIKLRWLTEEIDDGVYRKRESN